MESRDDTIAAVATPAGTGGIGIIKMSGPRSAEITARIFKPRNAVLPLKSHRLYYGEIVDPDTKQTHHEVLVSFMAQPRSYTREDVIEINCHGGYLVLQQILSLLVTAGARLAEPGALGAQVQKSGRTTGRQFGTISSINNTILVNYGGTCGTAKFVNQIGITNGTFSGPGESGSLILHGTTKDSAGRFRPVGLLFAGGGGITFANRIDDVLGALSSVIDTL